MSIPVISTAELVSSTEQVKKASGAADSLFRYDTSFALPPDTGADSLASVTEKRLLQSFQEEPYTILIETGVGLLIARMAVKARRSPCAALRNLSRIDRILGNFDRKDMARYHLAKAALLDSWFTSAPIQAEPGYIQCEWANERSLLKELQPTLPYVLDLIFNETVTGIRQGCPPVIALNTVFNLPYVKKCFEGKASPQRAAIVRELLLTSCQIAADNRAFSDAATTGVMALQSGILSSKLLMTVIESSHAGGDDNLATATANLYLTVIKPDGTVATGTMPEILKYASKIQVKLPASASFTASMPPSVIAPRRSGNNDDTRRYYFQLKEIVSNGAGQAFMIHACETYWNDSSLVKIILAGAKIADTTGFVPLMAKAVYENRFTSDKSFLDNLGSKLLPWYDKNKLWDEYNKLTKFLNPR